MEEDPDCDIAKKTFRTATLCTVPFACAIIVGLSFYQRRKQLFPGCCQRRPGLIIPINMMSNERRPWMLGAALVILTNEIFELFNGSFVIDPAVYQDDDFKKKFGWTRTLLVMVNVLVVYVVHMPLLYCIVLRRRLIASAVGLIYLIPIVAGFSLKLPKCTYLSTASAPSILSTIYGLIMAALVPASFLALTIGFIYHVVLSIKQAVGGTANCTFCGDDTRDLIEYGDEQVKDSILYLHSQIATQPTYSVQRLWRKWIYDSKKGFRYSTRMLCTAAVAAIILLKLNLLMARLINLVQNKWQSQSDASGKQYLYAFYVSLIISSVAAFLMHVVFLLHILICYRKNLMRLFRGVYSFQPGIIEKLSPANTVHLCMAYPGYQVAYIIYSYFIMTFSLCLILMMGCIFVIIPIYNRQIDFCVNLFLHIVPGFALTLVIYAAQFFICRQYFSQDNGKIMALKNIRWYNVVSCFFLFYNILVGLFIFFKRLFLSCGMGVLLVSRLDKPLLLKGFERYDKAYVSYLAMLKMELYHNHPALMIVLDIWTQHRLRQNTDRTSLHVQSDGINHETRHARNKRLFRNKIFKAITIKNNPGITSEYPTTQCYVVTAENRI